MTWLRAFRRTVAQVLAAAPFVIVGGAFHWNTWQSVAFAVLGMYAIRAMIWVVAEERRDDRTDG